MAQIAQVLKAEIVRISRQVTKSSIKEIIRVNKILKRSVVDFKKRLAQLEKENKLLKKAQAKQLAAAPQSPPEEAKRARLTSKGVRALRKKLRLTRQDFAKLVGTSPHSVYLWETKEGDLKLRPKARTALLSLRGVGAREAKKRLAEVQG